MGFLGVHSAKSVQSHPVFLRLMSGKHIGRVTIIKKSSGGSHCQWYAFIFPELIFSRPD